MNAAAAYFANTNHAANDWARSQTARTMARAAMNSNAVVYRPTWPAKESSELPRDAEYDLKLPCDGWHDSTLDLRDGLSVVEVFTTIDEAAALQEFALLRR
jgi:hypothetical protein